MTKEPTEDLFAIVGEAIDLAIKCVSTGETLIPFVMTDGDPGAIITLMGDSFDQSLNMAQEKIDGFGVETRAFAFAYDGFITLEGERTDAIYVEAARVGDEQVFMFGQRYRPKRFLRPVKAIGNPMYLQKGEPKLRMPMMFS